MPPSGKKLIKLLRKKGWQVKSQRGSHVKMEKEGKITEVPIHGNHDLGWGLINAIEKQTGEKLT